MSRVGPDIHRGPGTFVCTQACRRAIPKLGCATSILPSSDVGACTSTCFHPYHSAPGPTLQQFQRGRQSAQVCRRHLISRPRAASSNDSPLNYQHYASSSGRSEEELEPQPDARQAATGQGWMPQVPWGWDTIVKVMALWMLGFLATGNWLVPLSLDFLGLVPEELSFRGHAMVHLLVDMMELVFTMLLLWTMLRQFKPLRHGMFRLDLRVGWWLAQVLVACLAFPAIDGLAHVSQSWFPAEGDFLATRLEQSLTAGDAVTGVLYFLVVSLCAPVWEETIFRGFLLTSLTRFMPPHLAVVASSVAFALCHFSLTRFVPLLVLGVVIGGVFVSSRNLLSPIALHSFWNFYIFFQFSLRSLQIV